MNAHLRPAMTALAAAVMAWGAPGGVLADDGSTTAEVRAAVAEGVAEHKVPAMWGAIADGGGVVAIGSAGVRIRGDEAPVADDDLVHLGSCTKAMTSVLLATLVRDGLVTWETTVAEALPEAGPRIDEAYRGVTLWELVTHRGGVRANATDWWAHRGLKLRARRLRLLEANLGRPANERGAYHYSNLGYMVAGCVAEAVADATWEELIRERVFDPLGMESAGFGPPGVRGKADQPRGHTWGLWDWNPKHADNAEALGPAGTVHCSVADWARFVALQLGRADTELLSRTALDRLTEPTGEYAAGWIVAERPWAGGKALAHSGSNTMWYATVWVAPATERAYFAVTNSCGQHSNGVCDELIGKLIAIDARRDDAAPR